MAYLKINWTLKILISLLKLYLVTFRTQAAVFLNHIYIFIKNLVKDHYSVYNVDLILMTLTVHA